MTEKKNGAGANRPPNHGTPTGSMVGVVYHSSPLGATMARYDVRFVEFPAVLVMARWDDRAAMVRAFSDSRVLHNEAELEGRLALYGSLEEAGAIPYTYTLAGLDEVDQVVADRTAELEEEYRPWADWVEDRERQRAALNGTL